MQKWEYASVRAQLISETNLQIFEIRLNEKLTNSRASHTDLYQYFNRLGQEGWEMVGVDEKIYYFKRLIE